MTSTIKQLYSRAKIDQLLAGKADLASLTGYLTSAELDEILADYALTSALVSALSGKSDTGHNHSISDIANLQATLNSKANSSDLSNYVLTSALSAYATNSSLSSTLANYVLTSALANYVTSTSLSTTLASYALASALSSYATLTNLSNGLSVKANSSDLNTYDKLVYQTATSVSTSSTSDTSLASYTLPGNSVSINGKIRIWAITSMTNNANVKNVKLQIGGTTIITFNPNGGSSFAFMKELYFRNSLSSQVFFRGGNPSTFPAFGTSTDSNQALSFDFSQNLAIALIGSVANASDFVRMEAFSIEVFKP